MQLIVTIYDGDGKVVEHRVSEAQTATQEEIDEMVMLIEGGMPEHTDE